jgi:FMN phosphatase YigB (HAD superfamily)
MKKTIAIDIDDVLADSTDLIRVFANKATGLQLEPHHYAVPGPYWSYYEHVLEMNGITDKKEQSTILESWIANHGDAEPIQGAIEALKSLAQHYTVVLITARDPKIRDHTELWLKKHFAGLYNDLHVIGNFKVVDKPKSKGEVCVEVGASWLIDDNPEHCKSAIDHGLNAVLFGDYGWHFDAPKHLTKCKDWAAVLEYFDGQTK